MPSGPAIAISPSSPSAEEYEQLIDMKGPPDDVSVRFAGSQRAAIDNKLLLSISGDLMEFVLVKPHDFRSIGKGEFDLAEAEKVRLVFPDDHS